MSSTSETQKSPKKRAELANIEKSKKRNSLVVSPRTSSLLCIFIIMTLKDAKLLINISSVSLIIILSASSTNLMQKKPHFSSKNQRSKHFQPLFALLMESRKIESLDSMNQVGKMTSKLSNSFVELSRAESSSHSTLRKKDSN